ncbi:MAG: beta-lactamase family protein, partial [Gemmatimonadota bacterium]|nr:beta-lactamase family protein [Gemmatimonadota bacterium]
STCDVATMNWIVVGVLALFQTACSTGAKTQVASGDPLPAIRRLVLTRAATDSFSGAVILAHCDSILLEIYAGAADRERQKAVGQETRFRIASMTKMLTGVAVMQLVQGGKLAPSDTISRLIAGLPTDPFERITIHQLLTHTAGLGSIWKPEFFSRGSNAFRRTADFLPLFVRDTLLFEPGARWAYSNAGYVLLGLAIERLSGESYPDYVRDRAFAPAGMSIQPADEIDRADPDRAIAYTRGQTNRSTWQSAEHIGLRRMMPAGGGVLSARDVHRFGLALLRYRLLDSMSTNAATTGIVEYRLGARYGYGFANELVNGQRIVFHDGGADGISTNLDLIPERGLIAIVLANLDPPAARPIRDALRAEMLSPHRSNGGSCH